MKTELDPIVDNWYFHLDKGSKFKVVAVDDDEKLIEIQNYDGDIEEITKANWRNLKIELCEEPQNWAGALDVSEIDDLGTEITDTSEDDWKEIEEKFSQSDKEKLAPEM
ncbi:MAG: hypothetical protein OEX07_07085 [Gammaproteobacteria bacterium]|nr:hypothetical protein [Gammaproteobacteria bacterium]